MHVIKTIQTYQGHAVPAYVHSPRGPFPPELLADPEIVYEYEPALSEDGMDYELGATAQNDFKPPRWLRCYDCHARVREDETDLHICEEL